MDPQQFYSGEFSDEALRAEARRVGIALSAESLEPVRLNLALLRERAETLDQALPKG